MQKQTEPVISVIMGIYNQQNRVWLEQAIHSVLNQSFRDFEFIIYNDGSNREETSYLEKIAEWDERIVLIQNPVNHGLAYSLNTCIDAARGKYLARMDDDDISLPNRLREQYEFMETHPAVDYVGCNAYLIDNRGVWGVRHMPENPRKQDFLRYSPFIHPTVMIRRRVFERTSGYRSSKETWRCEDYELFMRLWKLGYRGYNMQQVLLQYREDRDSYKKRQFRYRMAEAHLRYRNFKELGILYPTGWLYVCRPILAALIPSEVILGIKRLYHLRERNYGKQREQTVTAISQNTEKSPDIV